MKFPVPIKLILAAIALTGALALTGLTNGCAWFSGKTPVDVAGTGEGVVIPTVNAGMTLWASWVNSGNATQAQVDQVKVAYQDYYQSQLIASNAFQNYFTASGSNSLAATVALQTVLATAASSQTNILQLIQTFTKTNK